MYPPVQISSPEEICPARPAASRLKPRAGELVEKLDILEFPRYFADENFVTVNGGEGFRHNLYFTTSLAFVHFIKHTFIYMNDLLPLRWFIFL
jgi:hypothetical protein